MVCSCLKWLEQLVILESATWARAPLPAMTARESREPNYDTAIMHRGKPHINFGKCRPFLGKYMRPLTASPFAASRFLTPELLAHTDFRTLRSCTWAAVPVCVRTSRLHTLDARATPAQPALGPPHRLTCTTGNSPSPGRLSNCIPGHNGTHSSTRECFNHPTGQR